MTDNIDVWISNNAQGKKIIGVTKEGKDYLFNSKYSDEALVRAWVNQTDISNYRSIALVFGMGNGEYIRALRNKNKDMTIIVFEPSSDIALLNKDDIGCDDLIKDSNIMIAVGEDSLTGIYDVLTRLMVYEVVKYTKIFVVPNYERVFNELLEKFISIYGECLSNVLSNRHSMHRFQEEMKNNVNRNILDFIGQYSLKDVVDRIRMEDNEGIPAIVVAAGPSLDKNILELKKAKGKSFIIAVDTALKPLANAGIIPDITLSIDSHKPLVLFEHEDTKDVPIIMGLTSNSEIKNIHRGMRIYQDSQKSLLDRFIIEYGKENIVLESGGSVTCDAFSLANTIGFKTVIFVGLDLAYTGSVTHSEQAYDKKNMIDANDSEYFDVEAIDGGMVKTEANLEIYRRWFEHATQIYKDIKFIDATEGGAKKNGMEIMALSDAIERECIKECCNYSEIIKETPKFFTEDEQSKIIGDLRHFDIYCDGIRKRLNQGLRAYEKLDQFNRKGKYTGKEFTDTYNCVTDINNWISEDPRMGYLSLYVADDDYDAKEDIFDEKHNVYEEIKLIVDNGTKLINSMIRAVNELEKDINMLMK